MVFSNLNSRPFHNLCDTLSSSLTLSTTLFFDNNLAPMIGLGDLKLKMQYRLPVLSSGALRSKAKLIVRPVEHCKLRATYEGH